MAQDENPDAAHIEQLNKALSVSIVRCRSLVDECRSKLVANDREEVGEQECPEEIPNPVPPQGT